METYRVVASGEVKPQVGPERAREALARLLQGRAEDVERLLGGVPVTVARHQTRARAERYVKALEGAGLVVRLEPETAGATAPLEVKRPVLATCPACGYAADRREDPLISAYDGLGECPKCGVIPGKVRAARAGSTGAGAEQGSAEKASGPTSRRSVSVQGPKRRKRDLFAFLGKRQKEG